MELHLIAGRSRADALVVIVNRHREDLLRTILADYILVQDALDLLRLGKLRGDLVLLLLPVLRDDVVAEVNAFIANVDRRACDQLPNLFPTLSAE